MGKKIVSYICAAIFILSVAVSASGLTADAANPKGVKNVTISADKADITKKTYTLEIGSSKTLKVAASPKSAVKSIRYQSDHPEIVAANGQGKVTAKKKGTAKIQVTVTGQDKKKKSVWVKIKALNPTIKSISALIDDKNVAGNTYSLELGEKKTIKANVMPANAAKSISYSSSNAQVASVDSKGTVTAKGAGTARITITATDKENRKKSVRINIKVTERAPAPEPGESNILIAYFSLAYNADYPDDVDATTSASIVVDDAKRYGTTEYLARIIQQKTGGTLHRIETKEAYPGDFDTVVDQNHQEVQDGTLPELKESDLDISKYDTVFVGYPVWATDIPQAVRSFLQEYDLSGKTMVPFCTHDGYGAGSSYRTIGSICPKATLLDGLAVRASDVSASEQTVTEWLSSIGVTPSNPEPVRKETPIKITIGDTVLDGVVYDTALAEELKGHFPLTVSMSAYGGREYYGGLDFTPAALGTGQLRFENGDITYCGTNNTMAIFYAQTSRPNLTMEVVPIGRVTSDLSVFGTFGSEEDVTFSLAGEGGEMPKKNKILVAYFSATGTTGRLAGLLADGLTADLHEIVPETPYTSADLNYNDSSSRSSIEMNDPSARPAISGAVENMAQYDVVFLGYPIWWGQAPRIVSTFLEGNDFSGKVIVPFCTSGSSGMGSSTANLHGLAAGADWYEGRRFGGSATQNDMVTWANGLGLGLGAE